MSYLIVLSIGPVQSYISQARRTQDLWQGSRILSHLARAGLEQAQVYEEQGLAEIIYPIVPSESEQAANIPNRMMIRWRGHDEGAYKCAQEMEQAIRSAWKTLSENTRRYFCVQIVEKAGLDRTLCEQVREVWKRQEQSWLECYWVVEPEKEGEYAQNIKAANAAMGARKLMRTFGQVAERGRKCSMTGEHEILLDGPGANKHWKQLREDRPNRALFGEHERLSAIGVIKRLAHEEGAGNPALQSKRRYPSTSSIATVPFKWDVLRALASKDDGSLKKALEDFLAKLEALFFPDDLDDLYFGKAPHYAPEDFPKIEQYVSQEAALDIELVRKFRSLDGEYLLEDTFTTKTIEERSGRQSQQSRYSSELQAAIAAGEDDSRQPSQQPHPSAVLEARQALRALLQETDKRQIARPQPYLVVLAMDGDHMGRTLGKLQSADKHRKLSKFLSDFTRDVQRIVEQEHLGRVVYAGGDDVLALLPVREALQVAEELRRAFKAQMANAGFLDDEGLPVHMSAGLAYVHHKHNLQDAVNKAHNALDAVAKEGYGRNAIGVHFLRRSGEARTMGLKWETNGNTLCKHVEALVSAFAEEGLARNLPYDVAQIVYSMGEGVPEEALCAELVRVLRRRLPEATENPEETKKRKQKAQDLAFHIEALAADSEESAESRWQNALSWLELARFIAQKEQGA